MKQATLLFFVFLSHTLGAYAAETYTFDCKDSTIQGHIRYAAIGSYNFSFKSCSGSLSYDPLEKQIKSVHAQIMIKSISSNCRLCDRVAVSRRLLNAASFPFISYQSHDLEKKGKENIVKGTIRVHGVSKQLTSPFTLKQDPPRQLTIKGTWDLKRKDYNIIWNKTLDHGGLLVGETVHITWEVHAHKS